MQEGMLREHWSLKHSKEPVDDVAKAFPSFKFGACVPAQASAATVAKKESKETKQQADKVRREPRTASDCHRMSSSLGLPHRQLRHFPSFSMVGADE